MYIKGRWLGVATIFHVEYYFRNGRIKMLGCQRTAEPLVRDDVVSAVNTIYRY